VIALAGTATRYFEGTQSSRKARKAVATLPAFRRNLDYCEAWNFWRKIEDCPSFYPQAWNGDADSYYLLGKSTLWTMKLSLE